MTFNGESFNWFVSNGGGPEWGEVYINKQSYYTTDSICDEFFLNEANSNTDSYYYYLNNVGQASEYQLIYDNAHIGRISLPKIGIKQSDISTIESFIQKRDGLLNDVVWGVHNGMGNDKGAYSWHDYINCGYNYMKCVY
jgi:hypothetical protein